MKSRAKVLDSSIDNGRYISILEFNLRQPKKGDEVVVKWGKSRSTSQNSLYWKYLDWLLNDGGMKDLGYIDTEELHEAFKGRFLAKREEAKGGFKIISLRSTTDLTVDEFMEYMDKIDDMANSFLGINTHSFWKEYSDLTGE